MATTSQILTWIELECHGWKRNGSRGTLALLNEAHRLLMTKKSARTIILDSTTGDYPYFDTTAGTFVYSCPSTVWMVDGVLIDAEVARDYGGVYNAGQNVHMRYERVFEHGKVYYRIVNISSTLGGQNTVAQITFRGIDPGTTSSYYRRKAFRRPTDISSDSIQHDMPDGLDTQYLMPATMKLIEAINDHGKMIEARQYIETILKPACWGEMEGGYQGVPLTVTKRNA